ncbi:selenocysteine-specific translation elongation factor [Clostridium sp. LIBA-8841]|uniref:selenocysteine-specific translation elongation factor n=1 Tax=Clostridium sp. LIBA-8841 TaxID=2987530 RepID=UPI002AC69616|nr:selenocysteine-specific translation elongation factor [Clostridium sp. LIBA-8841]MDZ5253067.1 selenocysteine-specific translation elongation factor [Clostridium sp. LIBA-8841]
MKHVIIGTSGHIDHGKTTLIKALTGRETDKLDEEKKRGISINLGFTFFDLPSGKRAGIIDVPGHEKFIKNMLAGATSLDVVLLIIALDEGIMPQTKEHLEILELLEVKKCIVALTKKDLVDEEWAEMIKEEIKNYLKSTSFKDATMIEVSSKTKEGINELITEIDKSVEEIEQKDKEGHFRLAVDRSFSVSGFGTVATGTILSGSVKNGDMVQINPSGIEARVRNIQVHDENVEIGEAGQRCALNLAGVTKDEVVRGTVVCTVDTIEPSYMIDCKFKYLKSNEKNLINRQRVRVYHGTSEILGRIVILDKEEVEPGESSYIQLRLESEICAQKGDNLVIRNYSPMITLGGGKVINPVAKKAKRFKEDYLNELKLMEKGSIEEVVENVVLSLSENFPNSQEIIKGLGRNVDNMDSILEELCENKKIIGIYNGKFSVFIHNKFFTKKSEEIYEVLKNFHEENPLKVGMNKEELRSKSFSNKVKQKIFQNFLELIKEKEIIKEGTNIVALKEFEIKLTKAQRGIKEKILKTYLEIGITSPKIKDIIDDKKLEKEYLKIYNLLVEEGTLVKLPEDVVMHKEVIDSVKNKIIEWLNKNGSITLGETKDILGVSRKYLVAILEYLDQEKVTKRVEDKRVLNKEDLV